MPTRPRSTSARTTPIRPIPRPIPGLGRWSGAVAILLLGGCHAEPEGARFVPASGDEPRRRVEAGATADGPARRDPPPAVRRIEMH